MAAVKSVLAVVGAFAAVAVGAGAGAVVVHTRDADRDSRVAVITAADSARITQARTPVTAGVRSDGSHYGSLFAFLLPAPSGWLPGPDVGSVGNNSYLTASQFNAKLQSNLLNVPKSDLGSTQSTLADLHLQAVAVRSMVNSDYSLELSFELLQLDPKQASADQKAMGDFVDGLSWRQGASVPGYPNASCALRPGLGSDTVDSMLCVATYGDVEVTLQADGVAPLGQGTAVKMLAQQLDRLKADQTLTVNSPDQGDQNE
jgi:hypothetical protein